MKDQMIKTKNLKGEEENSNQEFSLSIQNMQIDNQLPSTPFPVLFIPKNSSFDDNFSNRNFFSITATNCVQVLFY